MEKKTRNPNNPTMSSTMERRGGFCAGSVPAAALTDGVAAAGQAALLAGQAVEAVAAALAAGPVGVAGAVGAVPAVARGPVQLGVKVALLGAPAAVTRCKDTAPQ